MIEEAMVYHSVIIKIFLVLLLFNLVAPFLARREIAKEMRITRVSFFLFSALLVMIIFSGMIAFMLIEIPWSIMMSLMVLSFIVLAGLEITRSIKLHKLWMISETGTSLSWKYVLLEIIVIAIMVLLMILEKKGAVSLS